MDVSNEDEVKAAVKAVLERFGIVEILVNNAGVTKRHVAAAHEAR